MKPDQEIIDAMIKSLEIYNNATTAQEGFGALNSIVSAAENIITPTHDKSNE